VPSGALAFAPLTVSVAAAVADPSAPAGVPTQDGMKVVVLQRFTLIQAGKTDRTHMPPPMAPN
jgi:hypothetical protein